MDVRWRWLGSLRKRQIGSARPPPPSGRGRTMVSTAGHIATGLKSAAAGSSPLQVECGSELAGAIVVVCPWLSGPYLQMLAILPAHQNQGIGSRILGWFEEEAREHFRNLWLCVSGFNFDAQRFYQAHGYALVATLDGLMRDGDAELLMRKRI